MARVGGGRQVLSLSTVAMAAKTEGTGRTRRRKDPRPQVIRQHGEAHFTRRTSQIWTGESLTDTG